MVRQEREQYWLVSETAELRAAVSGRYRHRSAARDDYPVVGDWVWVESRPGESRATIVALAPRRSLLVRQAAGRATRAQPLVANVDLAFLVSAANRELNVRRVERFLTGVWDTGATPVVVVNKMDLAGGADAVHQALHTLSAMVEVLFVSAHRGDGLEELEERLTEGRTAVFLGSSGVGKSTLINRLLGSEVQEVREIRDVGDKGRHTTTRRELFLLPTGGAVIDTPGVREFGLWEGDPGSFADIEELAGHCRFRDCGHDTEPGCAIRAAIDSGELDADRLASYRKMRAELRRVEAAKDQHARLEEKRRIKRLFKGYKAVMAEKKRRQG